MRDFIWEGVDEGKGSHLVWWDIGNLSWEEVEKVD